MTRRWSVAAALIVLLAGCGRVDEAAPKPAPPIQVRVTAARRGDISETLTVSGQTAALTVLRLASPVAGRVTFLSAHPGDRVERDAVAARVVPLENEAAIHGFTILGDNSALSPAERADAGRLRRQLVAHAIALHAPFAAVVADRLHNPGEQVAPNDVLLELFDPHSLYVLAQVPIASAPRVRVGMPVEISGSALRATGAVSQIQAAMAPQSLTVPVRISPAMPLEPPLLNAAVQCNITMARHADALLIPRSALLSSPLEQRGTVMVAVAGHAQQRPVGLGLRTDSDVEVIDGLSADDLVLVDGQYALPDRAAIEPVQAPSD